MDRPMMRRLALLTFAVTLTACTPQEAVWLHFWDNGNPELHRQAQRIVDCETGHTWDPRARNPSGASGLFQIMPLWAGRFEQVTGESYWTHRFEPFHNAQFARWLWGQTGDWRHWTCRKAL